MTRRLQQRILLSFVCALALILIPLSYSPAWAQSTYPSTTQQDKTDQNNVDQNQTQTQSNQSLPDGNSSTGIRQKPDSSVNDPNSEYQNQNRSTTRAGGSASTDPNTDQNSDQSASNRNLPNTAGELPLIALIGLLSLGAAAGTRLLARVRSSR